MQRTREIDKDYDRERQTNRYRAIIKVERKLQKWMKLQRDKDSVK